jgi:hypothetical protein
MKPASPPFCELAQSMPSSKLHCAPVAGGWPQMPNVLFCGIWQSPPQQSLLALQMSPFCPQYEGAEQILFWQKLEQQSPFCAHAFPSELQFGLIGVHLPLPHVPPQHWPSLVQGWLSLVHEGG